MATLLQPNLFDHVDGPPGALVVRRVNYATIQTPCKEWHYAAAVPANANYSYGVWENGQFRGVIAFGTPVGRRAHTVVSGLEHWQVKELLRIAMNGHDQSLTKMISLAIGQLKQDAPETALLISYRRPECRASRGYLSGCIVGVHRHSRETQILHHSWQTNALSFGGGKVWVLGIRFPTRTRRPQRSNC